MIDFEFCDAVRAAGMCPPDQVIVDDRWHRFSASGKRDDESGAYVLHQRDRVVGVFRDYRTGVSVTWHSGGALTDEEKQAAREKQDAVRQQAAAARERQHARARAYAVRTWAAAHVVVGQSHPYLARKGVSAHWVRRSGELLVVPCRIGTVLHSLQTIGADGTKRFVHGGRVTGTYHAIRGSDTLAICEGYATGATIHEATGWSVAVAFCAGNLLEVARALALGRRVVVCADDDWHTEGNPGLTAARAAALAVGAVVAFPVWSGERGERDTDWNDLARTAGQDEVRRQITCAAGT